MHCTDRVCQNATPCVQSSLQDVTALRQWSCMGSIGAGPHAQEKQLRHVIQFRCTTCSIITSVMYSTVSAIYVYTTDQALNIGHTKQGSQHRWWVLQHPVAAWQSLRLTSSSKQVTKSFDHESQALDIAHVVLQHPAAACQCRCAYRLCCVHCGLGHAAGCGFRVPVQRQLQQGLCGAILIVPMDHTWQGYQGPSICNYR